MQDLIGLFRRRTIALAMTLLGCAITGGALPARASTTNETNYLRACDLARDKKHVEAIKLFTEILAVSPRSAATFGRRAWSWYKLGRFREALNDYNEAINFNAREAAYYLGRGTVLLNLKQYALAHNDFRKALSYNPKSELAHSQAGVMEMKQFNRAQAAEEFEEALKIHPEDGRLHAYLSACLDGSEGEEEQQTAFTKTGLLNVPSLDRLDDFETALAMARNKGAIHRDRALVLIELGQYETAYDDLLQAVSLGTKDALTTKTMDSLRQMIATTPDSAGKAAGLALAPSRQHDQARISGQYVAYARRFMAAGQYDNALAYLHKAIQTNPRESSLYAVRAEVYERSKNLPLAFKDLDEAISLSSKNPDYFKRRGQLFETKGDTARALQDYSQWLKLQPGNLVALKSRAQLLSKKGDNTLAIEDYSAMLERTPNDASILAQRAQLFEATEAYDQALNDYNRLLVMQPGDSNLIDKRMQIMVRKGSINDVLSELNRLCQAHPKETKYLVKRADLLEKADKLQPALADMKLALTLEPKSIELRKRVAELTAKITPPAPESAKSRSSESDLAARLRRASVFLTHNKLHEARLDYDLIITQDPSCAAAYEGRAQVLMHLKEYTLAISDYGQAMKLTPTNMALYLARADAFKKLGNLEAAQHDLELAKRLGSGAP